MSLREFLASYIETALWSSIVDNGDPMDRDRGPDDIATETVVKMLDDCAAFRAAIDADDLVHDALVNGGHTDRRIAHDFWLTRNRHGAGFWDGDYPERLPDGRNLGDALTTMAHAFGEVDLYVGDDGRIYA